MSLTYLTALRCRPYVVAAQKIVTLPARSFHAGTVSMARKPAKAAPVKSKAQIAAAARRKETRGNRGWYSKEKMMLKDAISVLRAVEVARPNATLELTIKTAMGKGITVPKGRYALPRETKRKNEDRILVFAEGRAAEEARRAGADIVGGAELSEGVANGTHKANLFLCTPSLIRAITPKLGRVLGPRGLMPSERRGTVTDDIAGYISRLRGTAEWSGDKEGTIRTPIAKMDFSTDDVVKNFKYFLTVVKQATGNLKDPRATSKGTKPVNRITKVVLSSPQGPGIQISDF